MNLPPVLSSLQTPGLHFDFIPQLYNHCSVDLELFYIKDGMETQVNMKDSYNRSSKTT